MGDGGRAHARARFLCTRLEAKPRASLLIAPVTFLLVWTVALLSGLRLDFARDRMLQFAGSEELASVSVVEAWRSLHMQPPGFNLLLKFSDTLGSGANALWLALLLLGTLIALWMVADIVWTLTGNLPWALVAGVLAAVSPGTLYYSLWVFYTQVAAVLLTSMVWGLVVGTVRGSLFGWLVAGLSALPLFAVRSTYVWVVVVVWLLAVMLLGWRHTARGSATGRVVIVVSSLVGICLVLGLQALTWTTFGVLTQSSWGYENAAKAVMTQLTPEQRVDATRGDTCLQQVLEIGVFEGIDAYPACALRDSERASAPRNALLENPVWANGYPNMNTLDRLALSEEWRTFVVQAVEDNPLAVARIPFPNFQTQERGTIVRFLWPSSWYWLIDANVSTGGFLASTWIVLFSAVPAIGILGIAVGLFTSRRAWDRGDPRRVAFAVSSVLVFGISIAYLFLETGENERFRAEIDWLIIALGSAGWATWLGARRTASVSGVSLVAQSQP